MWDFILMKFPWKCKPTCQRADFTFILGDRKITSSAKSNDIKTIAYRANRDEYEGGIPISRKRASMHTHSQLNWISMKNNDWKKNIQRRKGRARGR